MARESYLGRVEIPMLPGYSVDESGQAWCCLPRGCGKERPPWRKVKGLPCSKGKYLQIGAYKKKYLIHRLVALMFLGECPPGKEVSHKDGNGRHNHKDNLEYVDHPTNERMKAKHGTSPAGSNNGCAKLKDEDVGLIRAALSKSCTRGVARKLAKQYGVSEASISLIKSCKRWRDGGVWCEKVI